MIDTVLYFNHDPGCQYCGLPDEVLQGIQKSRYSESIDPIRGCHQAFKQAIKNELRTTDTDHHIVPLSSGLDSRAILAGLLDNQRISNNNITTITYGTPGTYDFKYGQKVAETAGVKNITIDLTSPSFDYSIQSFREYAQKRETPGSFLTGYLNHHLTKVFDKGMIWSGFMGDRSAGSQQPTNPASDWRSACEEYASKHNHPDILSPSDFNPLDVLPDEPYFERNIITYEEQLDFAHRQPCFIGPNTLIPRDRFLTPYLQPSWLSYILHAPPKYRNKRSLFIETMIEYYPDLFSVPTESNQGLPPHVNSCRSAMKSVIIKSKLLLSQKFGIQYQSPFTNYVDFCSMFRENKELNDTMSKLVTDLATRNIIQSVDPITLWENHQQGEDHTRELRKIASLELYLSEARDS